MATNNQQMLSENLLKTTQTIISEEDELESRNEHVSSDFQVLAISMVNSRQPTIQSVGVLAMDADHFQQFHRLRRLALKFCIFSLLLDIGLGLTAFVNCVQTGSFAGFSYSVDTLMDSLCTGFATWHLHTVSITDLHRRDRLACCVIGALFIGSGLAIESRAIQSMILAKPSSPDLVVFFVSLIHIIAFTILSVLKIFLSKQIKSRALMAEVLNSIIGLIMSFPLLLWDRLTFFNRFANLDDLVQVLMALFLFIFGWKLILDSITMMNAEYARTLREEKLQRILNEHYRTVRQMRFDNEEQYEFHRRSIALVVEATKMSYLNDR